MTLTDTLLSIGILIVIALIFYLKSTKQTVKDLILDIKEAIKSIRDNNE